MIDLGENHLKLFDYVVIGVTLLGSLGIGLFYACSKQTTEDLLVGGRSMGPLPIAASMIVTYLSAISILGYPSEIYYHGIEIFTMSLLQVIFIPLSAFIIVPVFYNMKLTSVYEYLEMRFDSVLSRFLASFIFIIQILFFMGVCLFAPAIALQHIAGIPIWLSITGIGLCGTLYTSFGGLKAVVWTDVFQLVMILVGMISIVIKGFISAGGITNAFKIANEQDRLRLLNFEIDPFMRHNTLNFFVGFGFTIFSMFGTHQPQVQRYSSLPTLKLAIKALILAIPLNLFTMALIALTGISIFATYSKCDPYKIGKTTMKDEIVPYFVVNELAFIPGMMGLFISCIFSAVLSTVSSALNSLSAVTWDDFIKKIPGCYSLEDSSKANVTRVVSLFYGIVTILLAFLAQGLGPVLPLTMSVVGATGGPLAAVFLIGLFLPCANKYGVNCGMIAGLISMFFISYKAFYIGLQHIPLPTSVEECPIDSIFKNATIYSHPEIEWPEKIYTVSYLLFPFMGAMITFVVSIVISIPARFCCTIKKVNSEHLHPWLRPRIKNQSYKDELTKRANRADIIQINRNSKLYEFDYAPVPVNEGITLNISNPQHSDFIK